MSIRDLMQMSLTNLLRRKLRTFLTVLGVVIGTASIVVMLSLGLGLKRSSLKQIEQYGGITTITVYPNEEQSTESGEKQKVQRLDDKAAEQVSRIPHVKVVSPVLQVDAIARIGRYQAYINIKGMTAEALRNMRLKIGQGSLPAEKGPLQLFFGNQVIHNFYSIKGNGEAPKIDPVKDTIFYIFDMEAYNLTQNGGVQGGGNLLPPDGGIGILNICCRQTVVSEHPASVATRRWYRSIKHPLPPDSGMEALCTHHALPGTAYYY